ARTAPRRTNHLTPFPGPSRQVRTAAPGGAARATSSNPKAPSQKGFTALRMELIETYMYFVSAPFLTIAVSYLLQVIATTRQERVLVVIAFAPGLMSDTVVGTIVVFADGWLQKAKSGTGAKPVPPAAEGATPPRPTV